MRTLLIILSSLLALGAGVPYIVDVIKGKTKPRLVSWFTWTGLMAVSATASLTQGQIPAAAFGYSIALQCLAVVVLGFRNGTREFELLDAVCLGGANLGLISLVIFHAPNLTIFLTIVTDFTGAIPTIRHAWRRPYEETMSSYVLEAIGCGITLLLANFHALTSFGVPLYLFLCDALIVEIMLLSPKRRLQPAPVAQYGLNPQPNGQGWLNRPVTVTFAGSDATGLAACSQPVTLKLDGAGQAVTGRVTNRTGVSTDITAWVNVDQSPPVLGHPNWSTNPVARGVPTTLAVPVTDHVSGVSQGEYVSDPNVEPGQGTPMTIQPGQLVAAVNTKLAPGRYPIGIRAKDAAGNWSQLAFATLYID